MQSVMCNRKLDFYLYCILHGMMHVLGDIYKQMPAVVIDKALETIRDSLDSYADVVGRLTLEDLLSYLKENDLGEMHISIEGNKARIAIEGCPYAKDNHQNLNEEFLCPHIILAMMVLRDRYGKVKFDRNLPMLTESGVIARLKLGDT